MRADGESDEADCTAALLPCPPSSDLAPEWRDLENRSDASVFLSWIWIGLIVDHLQPGSRLLRVTRDGRTVGLALLGRTVSWPAFPAALCLNETGDRNRDQVMIEYNGILAERGLEPRVMAACLRLLGTAGGCLRLSGVGGDWLALCRTERWHSRLLRNAQPSPYTDLTRIDPEDPLARLGRNDRQQIRRTFRYYEAAGPLRIERAESRQQALVWLDALAELHTRSWHRRGQASAFEKEAFAAFHRRLVAAATSGIVADLLRVSAGSEQLGYLYNLCRHGTVYAYQSGFFYQENISHARPGLVAHIMAMSMYSQEGRTLYRFLAGDARYKTSLATGRDELFWLTAHPRTLSGWTAAAADRVRDAVTSLLTRR